MLKRIIFLFVSHGIGRYRNIRYHCEKLLSKAIFLWYRKVYRIPLRKSLKSYRGAIFLFLALAIFQDASFAQRAVQKAVLIVASQNFRDEELLLPKDILETNRVKVVLASSSLSPARGMLGSVVRPDILIKDIKVEDFDAVIFVGGSGAKEYWDDAIAHNIALQAADERKIIGAICIAPVTLAKAGVLKGKKATVWSGVSGQLQEQGAIYTGNEVEIDENIITANGPQAAAKFGEALVKALVRRR